MLIFSNNHCSTPDRNIEKEGGGGEGEFFLQRIYKEINYFGFRLMKEIHTPGLLEWIGGCVLLAKSEVIWFTKYKLVYMNQNRDQLCMVE